MVGSSPRGRGKPSRVVSVAARVRLIPARAGKTCAGMRSTRRRPAHPRAGGENFCDCMNTRGGFGSSPRGRGKPRESPHRPGAHRLIPARAGKTRAPLLRKAPIAAHPRAGGENTCHRYGPHLIRGSSPRGRGKRRGYVDAGVDLGLIPARAGKTRRACGAVRRPTAHPRAGGENMVTAYNTRTGVGSSPRGRGKRHPGREH